MRRLWSVNKRKFTKDNCVLLKIEQKKQFVRAKSRMSIDILLKGLYNLSKIKNTNFKLGDVL